MSLLDPHHLRDLDEPTALASPNGACPAGTGCERTDWVETIGRVDKTTALDP